MIEKGSFINNRYEIVSRVGAGGMSDVYKAKDHKLNRNVAIKVLKKEFSKDRNFVSKFRVEAQSAASLIHPNIVNVYDVGEDEGLYYIVMELIEGITLKRYISKKGKLSFREVVSIAIQIANGIECAHNNQIVHRDIKPQNIMISREGKVKVTDFGIARAASANTMSGTAMGSVHYISPEQAGGKYVDEKSDIYSLGITMFEMITGRVPFDGESTVTIALKHIQNHVPSVSEYRSDIPISLDKIIRKCTQNRADNRYPKISMLIADLKRALKEPDVDFVTISDSNNLNNTIILNDNNRDKNTRTHDEDDIDLVDTKTQKFLDRGGIVVGVIALTIIAIIATIFFIDKSTQLPAASENPQSETIDPKKTVVPNVVGMSADEAEETLNNNFLGVLYESEYVYSDTYPSDSIVSQSETPGSVIDRNTTVKLTLSKGPEKINVPDKLVGLKLEEAIAKLDKLGLTYELKYDYSAREINTVTYCYPMERAAVAKTDVIMLKLSRGTKSTGDKIGNVPNVVGASVNGAKSQINNAGFTVGNIKYVYDEKVSKDKVIRQNIKGGTKAPSGTAISIVVSKGSKKAEEESKKKAEEESRKKAEEESKKNATKYQGEYSFAKEDLKDENGNPITGGRVTIMINGEAQKIAEGYEDVANWPGDYTGTYKGPEKGKATVELLVNGKVVATGNVKLK